MVVSASLQDIIAANRSAGDGSLSSITTGDVCVLAEVVVGMDHVAKMPNHKGEEREEVGVLRSNFGLLGDITRGGGMHAHGGTDRVRSAKKKKLFRNVRIVKRIR